MPRSHSLSSDKRSAFVFSLDFGGLDAESQEELLNKLVEIAPNPHGYVRKKIRKIDISSCGSGRLYTKIVDIPQGHEEYHVVHVLYFDTSHDYDEKELTEYSVEASRKLSRMEDLDTVSEANKYIRENGLWLSDIEDLVEDS
jgi:DNA-directed RNA polymerase subunit F